VTKTDEELLARAAEHCFMAGVGDIGEKLCAANMPYGIAKIQWAQRELGHPPDATFVAAPDATVTRNVRRWQQGFGYGGRIQWTGDFGVLDIKSNGCGMLVGALPSVPEQAEIAERARKLVEEGLEVEGVPIEYDLDEGNHFLDVVETTRSLDEGTSTAPAYFVMHSSGHEHRRSSPFGSGIYYDQCEPLAARARILETPWGTLHVLDRDDAKWFFDVYMSVQHWNHRRREAIADVLFPGYQLVTNATHQGMTAINAAHLGCYVFDDADLEAGTLFPLTLSAQHPVYLVRPRPNITEQVAADAQLLDRARKHGVLDRIVGANMLPHGGGYLYPQFRGVAAVRTVGPDDRRFEMLRADGTTELMKDPRPQAFGYRGSEIVARMMALELGDPAVETEIQYVLREAGPRPDP